MTYWMQKNGDLVENWAFGIIAWLALTMLLVGLAVVGIVALVVHIRQVRRAMRLQAEMDREDRMIKTDKLLR
jgi:uncharacterized membrane-anchored protein YhcB (DUF1043 family)